MTHQNVCSAVDTLNKERKHFMLNWALMFLIVAIIAGIFGFGSIVVLSVGIAKILFFIFIVLFFVTLLMHLSRGKSIT